MNTLSTTQTSAARASSHPKSGPAEHHWASNLLYQAATVLAILLFLISF